MSIAALPPSTVRVIGSAQVLTTPDSFVKELIDNALDARATAIFVEVAANTIDTLQVRNNGHGVAPEDRDLVCRRYCTSKISDEKDLRSIGGSSLGFRGEALASAAELSGAMLMTTRVEGEPFAVGLRVGINGELAGREKASHPVGTTVRITDLFKNIPVRKQTAVKTAPKCLAKTKRIMQSYAMARPAVRFSLKVLKAKSDKGNWMYAPKPGSGIEDAAFKVVGKDCAGQCHSSVMEYDGFEVQAFLPRVDADPSKISNTGHFVSIDSRPVSTTRGVLNQIIKIFKERIKAASSTFSDVKDPFLWMNIVCPSTSYDANIEPAKDDVLFEDGDKVLQAVRSLFDVCYPATTSMILAAAHDVGASVHASIHVYEDLNDISEPPSKRQRIWQPDVYYGHDSSPEMSGTGTSQHQTHFDAEERSDVGLDDVRVTNPWTMAKMNATICPRRSQAHPSGQMSSPLHEISRSVINSSLASANPIPPHPPWALPTPDNSSSPLRELRQRKPPDDGFSSGIVQEDVNTAMAARQQARQSWTAVNDFIPARQLPLDRHFRQSSATSVSTIDKDTFTRTHDPAPEYRPSLDKQQRLANISSLFHAEPPDRRPGRARRADEGDQVSSPTKAAGQRSGRREKLQHPTTKRQDADIRNVFDPGASLGTERQPRAERQRRAVVDLGQEGYEDESMLDIGPLPGIRPYLATVNIDTTLNDNEDKEEPRHLTLEDFDPISSPARRQQPHHPHVPHPHNQTPNWHLTPPASGLQTLLTTLTTSITALTHLTQQLYNLPLRTHIPSGTVYPDTPPRPHDPDADHDGGDGGDDGKTETVSRDEELHEPPCTSLRSPTPEREEVEEWRVRVEAFLRERGCDGVVGAAVV